MKRQLGTDEKLWKISENFSDLETLTQWLETTYPASENVHSYQDLKDVNLALKRLVAAIDNKERIMVFGDFDADGVTATVTLVDALHRLGAAVSYRIPERAADSHGLKDYLIDEITKVGTKLVVTVDCGINDQMAVKHAVDQELEIIITDHHKSDPDRFPDAALAVINPHQAGCEYPGKNLSGVGIVFKLVQGLADHYFSAQEAEVFTQKYLDVVAIGLVADCMQITGEVKTLVSRGLAQLTKTQWPGLALLLQKLNIDPQNISEDTIGFYLGPVINAASRLGEVQHAVQLFLGADNHEARVDYLLGLNHERKRWSREATEAAQTQIVSNQNFQIITTKDWPVGVLGLVAGQWCEKLNQPVIVMRQEGDTYKASCRAPGWTDIELVLREKADLFTHVGGHAAAAGFALPTENQKALRAYLTAHYKGKVATRKQQTVNRLEAAFIDFELIDLIESHAPYGIGAPAPAWLLEQAEVLEVNWMGAEKNHVRLTLKADGQVFSAVKFRATDYKDFLKSGQVLDVYFTLRRQVWRDEERVQLMIVDVSAK